MTVGKSQKEGKNDHAEDKTKDYKGSSFNDFHSIP
jgi:hypothetical protein